MEQEHFGNLSPLIPLASSPSQNEMEQPTEIANTGIVDFEEMMNTIGNKK